MEATPTAVGRPYASSETQLTVNDRTDAVGFRYWNNPGPRTLPQLPSPTGSQNSSHADITLFIQSILTSMMVTRAAFSVCGPFSPLPPSLLVAPTTSPSHRRRRSTHAEMSPKSFDASSTACSSSTGLPSLLWVSWFPPTVKSSKMLWRKLFA